MADIVHGSADPAVEAIRSALEAYEKHSPGAVATLYRQNSASVRVRIVDVGFGSMSRGDRHDRVWNFLAGRLDDDVLQEISVLLLLAPGEQPQSFMNFEFEHPIASGF